MNIEFNNQIKEKIKKESLNKFPYEACGLIFFKENEFKFDIYPCKNSAEEKDNNFVISPIDYIKCSKLGKITACYHSHTNDNIDFSEIDKTNSNNYKLYYILYNVKYDSFHYHKPNQEKNKYIGRPFILGISDCFTLVQEYAIKEENVKIQFPHNILYPKNLNDIKNLYEDHFEKQGFIKMNKDIDLKKSDGLMMTFPAVSKEYPTHAAVYIGNNMILHQPFNSFSCVNIYDNFFKKHTSYVLRHRSKL